MYRVINGKLQKVTHFAEPSDVQVDALLTGVSIGYRIEGFIATEVLPPVMVPNETFKFPTFSRENAHTPGRGIRRADKAPYARSDWTVTYTEKDCIEYGVEVPVSDRERKNAMAVINPDDHANNLANDLVANQVEADAISILTSTAYMTSNATLTSGDQWSDFTNSDPIGQIDTRKQTIMKAIHKKPNVLVIGQEVYDKLKVHPQLRRELNSNIVAADQMAAAFGVERVIVSSATYDSNNIGATQSGAFMWGKHALLAFVVRSAQVETPALGYTFVHDTRRTERYRDESIRADIVRVRETSLSGITNAASAFLLKSVVA